MFLTIEERLENGNIQFNEAVRKNSEAILALLSLPYRLITTSLITDFKKNGKWVKTIGSGADQKTTRSYRLWKAMKARCGNRSGNHPAYKDCTMSENFQDFQYFAEWCQSQPGYSNPGWQLDKDILIKGNKEYGESTCCFVPPEINNLFLLHRERRGDTPIGVRESNGKYVASCANGEGKSFYIGAFETEKLAFAAYKRHKKLQIRSKANEYKDQLSPLVYQALLSYDVSIND